MKIIILISIIFINFSGHTQVELTSPLTIYDGIIEEINRTIKVDLENDKLVILTKTDSITDIDNYKITDKTNPNLLKCIKPDNNHPTQFKFNYIDSELDNIQVINKNDTIARMLLEH